MCVVIGIYFTGMGLDGVEIVMSVETEFGISISDAEAEVMQTPRDLIRVVCEKVGAVDGGVDSCAAQVAFHRVRAALVEVAGCERAEVRLDAQLRDLLPKAERDELWRAVCTRLGLHLMPRLTWLRKIFSGPNTVEDLVFGLAGTVLRETPPKEVWTRGEVRAVVRMIIIELLGVRNFSDDAEFVRDLGC